MSLIIGTKKEADVSATRALINFCRQKCHRRLWCYLMCICTCIYVIFTLTVWNEQNNQRLWRDWLPWQGRCERFLEFLGQVVVV